MRKFFRRFLKFLLFLFGLLGVLAVGIAIFVHTAPQFGADPEGEHLAEISASPNFKDGIFVNKLPSRVGDDGDMWAVIEDYMNVEHANPTDSIPANFDSFPSQQSTRNALAVDTSAFLTWYGHSTFLLEIEGKNILLDPMFGPYASPVRFFGKRFPYTNKIDLETLPDRIDAVIMSHDHYDHLDYPSILALKDKVEHFYMPLGMSAHFLKWGVSKEKITELDWWESIQVKDLEFVATPARHFSGRGLTNRFKTLWASWVIRSARYSIYFSGDGGYFDGFKEIGEKYGPFDFCMMECGQYNAQWPDIHMTPEQTVQAHMDLKGKVMMPIHWGAFNLAPHDWREPVRRAQAEAENKGVTMFTPVVGERFQVTDSMQTGSWWKEVE